MNFTAWANWANLAASSGIKCLHIAKVAYILAGFFFHLFTEKANSTYIL